MAELTVDLSTLANGEEVEEWYPLSGITPIGEWGSIRLRTRYTIEHKSVICICRLSLFMVIRTFFFRYMHDLVMPSEEYSPLQQLILEPGLLVVRALADLCHADRMPLATGY